MSKRFSAHYIFPILSPPIKNGIITINDTGLITEIINPEGELAEQARLEFYNGILVPGFEGLTIARLAEKQNQAPGQSLNETIASFATTDIKGFEMGKSAAICLLTGLDLVNLQLTPKSRLKKLV